VHNQIQGLLRQAQASQARNDFLNAIPYYERVISLISACVDEISSHFVCDVLEDVQTKEPELFDTPGKHYWCVCACVRVLHACVEFELREGYVMVRVSYAKALKTVGRDEAVVGVLREVCEV
jgi:hypothetical protein